MATTSVNQSVEILYFGDPANNVALFYGAGTPEGNVSAGVGYEYNDTTNGVKYMKKTGTGNTGWKLVTQAA